ncbi:MAG: hypothetical protein EOM12_06110 [Verrucomicrobiae bacterium]|nr:hypothetical protein [Verrucomicrobiae bacterium]
MIAFMVILLLGNRELFTAINWLMDVKGKQPSLLSDFTTNTIDVFAVQPVMLAAFTPVTRSLREMKSHKL